MIALFDELDALTREPFLKAKAEIDARLAKSYGIAPGDLRPWHFHDPFFQETPAVFDTDLDAPYKKADILKLCREFYAGIGLPIDDVIARSDLYEKPGKSPHAFCTDIDREGDVRVLGNIVPNEYWMGTMLHELGHSVYSSSNMPRSVPYVLRIEAHILTTEGVAMMFEKFSKDADWLIAMGVQPDDPAAFDAAGATMLRLQLLIFSRWCQVMLRFEKALYDDPDQDLDSLWWDLVEKYQGLSPSRGPKSARLRQQDPHRQRPVLLPQLHDGPALRLAGPPRDRPRGARRSGTCEGKLRRPQGRRRLSQGEGVRARPHHDLERPDPPRHRRRPESDGLRGGFPGVIPRLYGRHVKCLDLSRFQASEKSQRWPVSDFKLMQNKKL